MKNKYDYIFIDEISMVQEIYYKFLIYLKRMNPKIKFIIAGDFEQLLPVKDRLHVCYYKYSLALHDWCHGNKLSLTKCRRSDDILFNMLLFDTFGNYRKHTIVQKHDIFYDGDTLDEPALNSIISNCVKHGIKSHEVNKYEIN